VIGTIVCVDDQAEVRRLLGDVFRARGSNVVSFDDGEDAIGWLNANDADLIILNTCHIREKASEKVYSELGRLRVAREEAARLHRDP